MAQKAVETLGMMTFLMLQSKSHQDLSISDMQNHCLAPLNAGLVACASSGAETSQPGTPMAFATFARVDDAWDAKLRDTDFKLSDMPHDAWTSGSHQWLVDLVATKEMAGGFAMQAARQVFGADTSLNIRLRNASGQVEIAEKTIPAT